jgi:hypothetical protein
MVSEVTDQDNRMARKLEIFGDVTASGSVSADLFTHALKQVRAPHRRIRLDPHLHYVLRL